MQIRRTDKINTEAAFHSLSEYMKWAEDWFRIEEYRTGVPIHRRIYVATDDPGVLQEATKTYPAYEVYGNVTISSTAKVSSRYTAESLTGVVIDIELLARYVFFRSKYVLALWPCVLSEPFLLV
ncbi:unnamed protein product [Gongylonema pulchrum]|uniref:GT23 domain-containing protein n=1 Tax=Gongylonema pulchrum TaxID=637853 RepID=A0A3P6RXP1_9BILA|nr:unnamed protein product [Gongylonema pulchrum]